MAQGMQRREGQRSVVLSPPDNRALANLCGPLDINLRQIEAALDVAITHRAGAFTVAGENPQAQRAVEALQRFYAAAEKPLSVDDIQLGLVEISTQPKAKVHVEPAADGAPHSAHARRADLHGRTPNQVEYLKDIIGHDITFGIGPAGTGKTYLAVACAVDALERDAVKRIVLVRPAVEAGESWDSFRAISRRRSIPTCGRSMTRCTTSWASTRPQSSSSTPRSNWRHSRTCAGARSTIRSSSWTRRRTRRPSR